jgi:hypothetical protein
LCYIDFLMLGQGASQKEGNVLPVHLLNYAVIKSRASPVTEESCMNSKLIHESNEFV